MNQYLGQYFTTRTSTLILSGSTQSAFYLTEKSTSISNQTLPLRVDSDSVDGMSLFFVSALTFDKLLRRICPGRHLAMQSVRMVISSILSTYNISKALDSNGVPIEPLIKATDGVVRSVSRSLTPMCRHSMIAVTPSRLRRR